MGEVFNCNNFILLLKNKYGNFVLQKTVSLMSVDDKKEIREFLSKKVNVNGSKEKAKLNQLFEQM
jgi:hypothetical protein